jgi:hypothetical protein
MPMIINTSTPHAVHKTLLRIIARIANLEARTPPVNVATSQAIIVGSGDPTGSVSATGPAIYMRTNTTPPTLYFKTSAGTSNTEWS